MNAVVVEAIDLLKAARAERDARDGHAAAIELAISVTQLPKGTAIILQTEHHGLRTDILVCEPSQTNYSILARVQGEEVVFDDTVAEAAKSGEDQ